MGLPIRPAADLLSSPRSRGRHGNALQWHFGLDPHDGRAEPDWEGRIEIKLVSVWTTPQGRVASDKLKVCDLAVDPWRKLSNVLFVFADRMTRVIVGASFFHLQGDALARLRTSFAVDPHFDEPMLFVESREHAGRSAPAYYLSQRWLAQELLLPPPTPSILPIDRRWWNAVRAEHGREPLPTLVDPGRPPIACPRCGAALRYDAAVVAARGWAPAWHGLPLGSRCAVVGHFAVDQGAIPVSAVATSAELRDAIEGRVERQALWRLADRVPEPEDHEHGVR